VLYLLNSDGLREALKGHDFKRALTKLHDLGLLPKDKQGKHSVLERIGGSSSRVYPIAASQLARCLYGN